MHQHNIMTRRNPRAIKKEIKEEKNNFFKIASVVLAGIIGLIIPAFYLFGLRFYEGILSAYGININSLALDTLDVYEYGYYAVAYVAYNYLTSFKTIMMIVVSLILTFTLLAGIYKVLMSRQSFMRIVYFFKSDDEVTDEFSERLFMSYYFVIVFLGVLAFLGIFWINIPNWAYKKGKETQRETIEEYHKKGCYYQEDSWNNCTQIIDNNGSKIYEGLVVAIKGEKVILYQQNGTQVITLQSDQKLYRPRLLEINATK